MTTQQLYAEVRFNAARNKLSETSIDISAPEAKALTTELQQPIKALNVRFDGWNNDRNKSKPGKCRYQGQNHQQGKYSKRRKYQGCSQRRRQWPYDPDKYCKFHNRRGHSSEECHAAKQDRRNEPNKTNFGSSYRPSFEKPREFSVNITRLMVNTATAVHTGDPHAWIIDSAANAYITPFKNRLHNYRDFANQRIQVKGFASKTELARGTGSITLMDSTGKRVTLNDVVYVPESPDQILSLIKLRREQNADFRFMATETFDLSFSNGVLFSGQSVNDILHIWTSSAIQINAVIRNVTRMRNADIDGNLDIVDSPDQNINRTKWPFDRQIHPNEPSDRHIETSCQIDRQPVFTQTSHSPPELWHLRFGHVSSTTLLKHPRIKSSFESTHCVICI